MNWTPMWFTWLSLSTPVAEPDIPGWLVTDRGLLPTPAVLLDEQANPATARESPWRLDPHRAFPNHANGPLGFQSTILPRNSDYVIQQNWNFAGPRWGNSFLSGNGSAAAAAGRASGERRSPVVSPAAFRTPPSPAAAFAAPTLSPQVISAANLGTDSPGLAPAIPISRIPSAPSAVAAGISGKARLAPLPQIQLTTEIVLHLDAGQDGWSLAKSLGFSATGPMNADSPRTWLVRASSVAEATRLAEQLRQTPGVQDAVQNVTGITRVPMSFVPNDPFYFPGSNPAVGGPGSTSSTSFPGQWHLLNQMPATTNNNPSIHVNVVPAWLNNFTGAGIITGVVDDAVQINHPDLFGNTNPVAFLHRSYSATGSVLANDSTPTAAAENHGTSVAGLIAARGGNGIGTTGAAPFANLVGMRTGDLNSNALVAAINHANGIGPGQIHIKNHSYGFVRAFLPGSSQLNTPLANSAAAGTVNVYSAGNNRGAGAEDANKIQPQNQPHVIVVAALGSDGRFSNYSNYGANVFVTAPSNVTSGSRFTRLISTDRTGSDGYNTSGSGDFASTAGGGTGLDYTNLFGGTSSSAPITAGVLALALEANPNLRTNSGGRNTTRALKHLLVRTSTVVDAADASQTSDGGWRTNAAGYRFNPNYGFGLINANALVVAAPQYVGVTPLTTASSGTIAVTGGALPDNNALGISRSFTFNIPVNQLQPLEEVVVTLSVTHPFTGDLQGVITSPSGTSLRFMNRSAADSQANLVNWQFTVNGFWGENPNGTWTINVADVLAGDLGTWNSFAIQVRMGDLVPVPEPAWLLVVAVAGFLAWRRFAGGI